MATEHGAAAGDADGRQRAAACETGFAAAAVYEELLLLASDFTPRVSIRVDGAAPVLDRHQ
jgi:hypothetical protein